MINPQGNTKLTEALAHKILKKKKNTQS